MTLEQFVPSLVGLHNLLKFARSSCGHIPRRFFFVSSFASGQSWTRLHRETKIVPEDISTDPEFAFGRGYGESKFVAESVSFSLLTELLEKTSF
jgi:thioester reductase-like protein